MAGKRPGNPNTPGRSTPVRHPALDRCSLPTPERYLLNRGLVRHVPKGAWVAIYCPIHKNGAEHHPSLRVNLRDGHFRCMACNVKGSDIIALHRLITGLGFRDAVRDLGGRFRAV
jgi:hypothetical protein